MMLKLIHPGLSGIQTHDICLVTGSHNLPKSAIFKTYKKRICLMIADRYRLDVSSQFQDLSKEMKAAIGFPTATTKRVNCHYLLCFSRSISFRSEKSSRVMAALKSHQQRSAIGKNQYIGYSSFSRR